MANITDFSNNEILDMYYDNFDSKQSINTRKHSIGYFLEWYKNQNLGDLDTLTLRRYFNHLKRVQKWALETKKTKWAILLSLVNFCLESFDDFLLKIPKASLKWGNNHKESSINKDVVLTKEEVKQVLDWLKLHHYTYYLIFRIFAETGMRKGELINIQISGVNIQKRYIETKGKTGKKVYYISKELTELLNQYIKQRNLIKAETDALFISNRLNPYHVRVFNNYIQRVLPKIGLNKHISCHSFRRTLNTLRKLMGCPEEDRRILINHKVASVNINSYVKLNYNEYIELFDRWNPFRDIII